MEEGERRRKPKPSVQGLHEELSTELTPLSGKKKIFRDALNTLFNDLNLAAPQLTVAECWSRILTNIIKTFGVQQGAAERYEPHLLI